ncbi:MAG: hypothetical protein IPM29_26445 [Planctomycetes bacterium]|nr:hypothetical protein [Planctomycetota bacterium]
MRLLGPSLGYFGVVFGAGFLLGTLRVLVLVPRVGVRTAELIELPIMVAVITFAARWRERSRPDLSPRQHLCVGLLALAWLLTAELALGVALSARSPREILLARDPLTGALYYAALLLFALLPWLRART